MPTEYKKKSGSQRGKWSQEQLVLAVEAIRAGHMGIREASRQFMVPPPTLRRRMKNDDLAKKSLGPSAVLGTKNEDKIKTHIKKLQKYGFSPTRESVRSMAFELAERLKIKHPFNRETRLAGYDWLKMFLKRNPDLSVRKSEGVSLARCQGMNRETVASYFEILEKTLTDNDLMDKPAHVFNMDETGLQLNNKPGFVIAQKGSKNVAAVTSAEKGETITVISCCNAEGYFLPPACIFKGKNKKSEFTDGMPPGSVVYMNDKSAYISTSLFLEWLKNHFLPRKPIGKVILILDGHSTHCNSVEMLEFAEEHDVILLCLPSHTTQFLQPLDRAFFKSLKSNFSKACNAFIKANPTRRITRLQFGSLLADAWSKSATVQNAVSSFRSTGICPFNPDAIPDYAFLTDEQVDSQVQPVTEPENEQEVISEKNYSEVTPTKETPGKLLDKINPVPSTSAAATQQTRKRSRQVAAILTSAENIQLRKSVAERKSKEAEAKISKRMKNAKSIKNKAVKSKQLVATSSSDESLSDWQAQESCDSAEDNDNAECLGCGEQYTTTTKTDDWIRCINCKQWFHEGCSKYLSLCHDCGKVLCKKKS